MKEYEQYANILHYEVMKELHTDVFSHQISRRSQSSVSKVDARIYFQVSDQDPYRNLRIIRASVFNQNLSKSLVLYTYVNRSYDNNKDKSVPRQACHPCRKQQEYHPKNKVFVYTNG